jgi:hypothetical protein
VLERRSCPSLQGNPQEEEDEEEKKKPKTRTEEKIGPT